MTGECRRVRLTCAGLLRSFDRNLRAERITLSRLLAQEVEEETLA